MDALTQFLLPAAVMIGLLVFVHELGHYAVGRWTGLAVEVFSIGFGPAILSLKRGETEYCIRLLPLGGYVKFYGMMRHEVVPEHLAGRDFVTAPYFSRLLTIAAGPLANFLFAILLFSVLGYLGIPKPQPVVGDVQKGGSADQAGLQFGDRIKAIDGKAIDSWEEMSKIVSSSAGKTLQLEIQRRHESLTIPIVPQKVAGTDMLGRKRDVGRLGVALSSAPAIISLRSDKSIAAQKGLRTGLRITDVKLDTTSQSVAFFREIDLWLASRPDSSVMELTLAETHKDGTPKNETKRTVVFDLKKLSERKLEALGIFDGQLVVAEPVGPLEKNDLILQFDGRDVKDVYELEKIQSDNKKSQVKLLVRRDAEVKEFDMALKSIERQMPEGKVEVFVLAVTTLGMPREPQPYVERYDQLLDCLWFGWHFTVKQTWHLAELLGQLFTGQLPMKSLGGPISIAVVAGDAAQTGLAGYLFAMSMISINLALLNFLPLPALDGGQILVYTFEALRRRRLSMEAVENIQRLGFVFILALIVLATYNDISRFWSTIVRNILGTP